MVNEYAGAAAAWHDYTPAAGSGCIGVTEPLTYDFKINLRSLCSPRVCLPGARNAPAFLSLSKHFFFFFFLFVFHPPHQASCLSNSACERAPFFAPVPLFPLIAFSPLFIPSFQRPAGRFLAPRYLPQRGTCKKLPDQPAG